MTDQPTVRRWHWCRWTRWGDATAAAPGWVVQVRVCRHCNRIEVRPIRGMTKA